MTMQATDTVNYRKKEYYLIDIEKGKQLINPYDYKNNPEKTIEISSACWRGYEATYEIKDNKLYLSTINGDECNSLLSFTGVLLIVRDANGYFNTDFLVAVYLFNEVLELVFIEGEIEKVNDLSNILSNYCEGIDENPSDEGKEEYLLKNCIAKYGSRSYKWRSYGDNQEDDYE